MSDEQQPAPVSPTGLPMVSQKTLRMALMVYAAVGAANGAMLAVYGADHPATRWTFIVLATVAPLLGIASPGWRKTP